MALQRRNDWQSGDGVFEVSTVTPLWQVDPDINLLDTVPLSWLPGLCSDSRVGDVDVGVKWVERFRVLWTYLSRPMRAWFNALFWHHPQRLRAFLSAPGSMKHPPRQTTWFVHPLGGLRMACTASGAGRRVGQCRGLGPVSLAA